jgi:hypothetical protein
METREAVERFEHAEETAEKREAFGRRAALLVSALAAFLAISGLLAARAEEEIILAQQKASDTWAEYQANSLKKHVNDDVAQTLRILGAGTAGEKAAADQAAKLLKANDDKYIPEQKRLMPIAQAYEKLRDESGAKHTSYQLAEAGFQLAIVLASIAIVARTRWLLYAAGGLGAAGLVFLVNGHFLIFHVPNL